jgi:ribonuclease P protein component
MSGRKFPASIRMRIRSELREIYSHGKYRPLGPIGVKYLKTSLQESRFLVTVKKNVGHAPHRNRIKRILREGIRHNLSQFNQAHDICLMVTHRPKFNLEFNYVCRLIGQLADELNIQ